MVRFVHHCYSDPSALTLGLTQLVRAGLTPRGLLFLALEPTGQVHPASSCGMATADSCTPEAHAHREKELHFVGLAGQVSDGR